MYFAYTRIVLPLQRTLSTLVAILNLSAIFSEFDNSFYHIFYFNYMFINHRAKYNILLQASGGFTINLSLETFVGVSHIQGPSIQKNGMHNSKIHTIYKQTSVFVLVLVLSPKQKQHSSIFIRSQYAILGP
jgi:hypothetical protein